MLSFQRREGGNIETTKRDKKKSNAPVIHFLCKWNADKSDLHTLQLLSQANDRSAMFLCKAGLQLGDKRGQFDIDTLLLGVVLVQTHLLDLDLAGGKLVFANDDTEGNTAIFGGLELLLRLGLGLVGELGLEMDVSIYA